MSKYITSKIPSGFDEFEIATHAANTGAGPDYDTMCGLDLDDPGLGLMVIDTPKGKKIDCAMCRTMFEGWKQFKASDFE